MNPTVMKRTIHWDGMCWPRPTEDEDDSVQWRLRYGPQPPSREDILYAASVMQAYSAIFFKKEKDRREVISMIRQVELVHNPRKGSQKETDD